MNNFIRLAAGAIFLALPMAAEAAESRSLGLPDFLRGCDAAPMPDGCSARAWDYADVVRDGFLSPAEVGRLLRRIGQNAWPKKIGKIKFGGEEVVEKTFGKAQESAAIGFLSETSRQVMLDYDYDGDGRLSRTEFGGEIDESQPPVLARLFTTAQFIHDFSKTMKWAKGDTVDNTANPRPGAGLVIKNILFRRDPKIGKSALVVSGLVKNVTKTPRDVPPLLITLLNAEGTALVKKTFAGVTPVAAEASAPFEVVIDEMPAMARRVTVTFTESPQ